MTDRADGPTMAYVGRCAACGGPEMATTDDWRYRDETASAVKDAIRRGLLVEHVNYLTTPIVMGCLPGCPERAREAEQLERWASVIAPHPAPTGRDR